MFGIYVCTRMLNPTINKEKYPLLPKEERKALNIVSEHSIGLLPVLTKWEAKSGRFHKTSQVFQ